MLNSPMRLMWLNQLDLLLEVDVCDFRAKIDVIW